MRLFDELCPAPPYWGLDWGRVREAFAWVRDLAGVEQDPVHHAEGDVEVHTRMACEALSELPEWRARPADERVRIFAAVLLHDVAKPLCTRRDEDGRVTAHGHSRGGDLLARRILWESGAPIEWREHVAALVRHHQVPFWALERPDLRQIAFRASLLARNDDLVVLATADILGRHCGDTSEVLDNIGLYAEYCAEQRCLDTPRAFPSDHARFWFFRRPDRDPDYAAHDDTRLTVTVMSGLPGAGKDHWIGANRPDVPVVSLDALRTELGVRPTADQRPVAAAAAERAREHLRAGRSFVWNATHVSRDLRGRSVSLAADYRARVEIVALEAPPRVLGERMDRRSAPVPRAAVERLVRRWECPDPTEAHRVTRLATGEASGQDRTRRV
ncbi:AAA family ATPase [Nocardiopsis sp. L17-MgMaSL7]|uniref:AAA family ATPase n=1 Tax=Nocardiopsis sp. L17-MgMaSL7 TaxID=1938893 RepID=UPI000D71C143|nr:AAA family ATPase [Nocardiopsis sp. L17-MgMaSL7]PWV44486.1 putative kinase [Nocardiopsis sp. L17-MgMaSL7]